MSDAADKLLTFSETHDERVKVIMSHEATIKDESRELSDPKVKAAIAAVWSACTGLISDASAAEEDARVLAEDLAQVSAKLNITAKLLPN